MSISRLIVGGVFGVLGIVFLFFVGFIDGPGVDFLGILTGLIFLAFGFVVFLNRKEDMIEARLDETPKKSKSLNKKENMR